MKTRIFSIAIVALFAGAALAGCAADEGDADPTPGGSTPATATPGTTTPPTSSTPVVPTNVLPITPPMTLKIGFMNPKTGPLSNLGPSMEQAMQLAVDDINAASAVTGLTVEVVGKEDDTTIDQTQATAAYDRLVQLDATVIAGPCCSGITGAVLRKAVEDEVVVSSPSATSPILTDPAERDNEGFFWRVPPNDALQGRVLAPFVREGGHDKANLIVIDNDYGNGFAKVFQEVFEADGGDVGTISKVPEEEGAVVSSQVTEACSGSPDAVVLVVYTADGAEILKAMQSQGCLANVEVYASEGIYSPVLAGSVVEVAGKDAQGNYLALGMKGTTPQAVNTSQFSEKYTAKYNSPPQQYAPESYDAVMYAVLGALKAKSIAGPDIAENMLDIATGGANCNEFRTCALLILSGQDVNYQGYAHDFAYGELHEPTEGLYSTWEVNTGGTMEITEENIRPE